MILKIRKQIWRAVFVALSAIWVAGVFSDAESSAPSIKPGVWVQVTLHAWAALVLAPMNFSAAEQENKLAYDTV